MAGQETLHPRGYLKGHGDWVTSIAMPLANPNVLLSASRDKTVIVWQLADDPRDPLSLGYPKSALRGHSHFVSEVAPSNDGQFALSSSWDQTIRLWDLVTGTSTQRFVGHTKDVLSVAFSSNNRQIVSGSRDRTVKVWNTLGHCKFTLVQEGHSDWVSCVRFSPGGEDENTVVSCGWDRSVKVWDMSSCRLRASLNEHSGYLNTVAVSPDGSLCASGGKDGVAMLWELENNKLLYSLDANDVIHALCFSPNRYWLCAATSSCIKIWDLEQKSVVAELRDEYAPTSFTAKRPQQVCISLAWSVDGSTLYAGYTDNIIRVWGVGMAAR